MNEHWKLFKVVVCFLNIRALGTWCAVAMAHSLEPSWTNSGQDWCSNVGVLQDKGGPAAVTAIEALALNGQNTFFINAAVMLWKSNAIMRGRGGAAEVEGAIATSGLPATLPGCAGWCGSTTLYTSSCRSQDKKDRWLRPCHLAGYNGCFSPKVVMSRFAFEQIPKPCYLLYIGDFTTELYRDYRKPVHGFLWTNQYNGMS